MNGGHIGLGRLASSDHGLVRQNHQLKARMPQRSQRRGDAGQQLQIFRRAQACLFEIQRAVAIEKNCRAASGRLVQVDLPRLPIGRNSLEPLGGSHVFHVFVRSIRENPATIRDQTLDNISDEILFADRSHPRPQRFTPRDVERSIHEVAKESIGWMRTRVDPRHQISRVGFKQVRVVGMVVRVHQHGKVGTPLEVMLPHSCEIDCEHHVAVEHKKLVRQRIEGLQQCACGSQRLRLVDDPRAEAESGAIADKPANLIAPVAGEDRDVTYPRRGGEREWVMDRGSVV
jgi:hypothetical protein